MSISSLSQSLVSQVTRELAKQREGRRISMNQLAAMTGLSLTTISYFERGLRNPTFETIARVSFALGVDLGKLIQDITGDPGKKDRSNAAKRLG